MRWLEHDHALSRDDQRRAELRVRTLPAPFDAGAARGAGSCVVARRVQRRRAGARRYAGGVRAVVRRQRFRSSRAVSVLRAGRSDAVRRAGAAAGDPARTRWRWMPPRSKPHRAVDAGDAPAKVVVGCGSAWGGQDVAIVDAGLRWRSRTAPSVKSGVRGASVAAGYWNRANATRETFHARLVGDDAGETFLRTGDLGFMRDGQLYCHGPAQGSDRSARPQSVSAGYRGRRSRRRARRSMPARARRSRSRTRAARRLAIVAELDRHHLKTPPGDVADAIRAAVAAARCAGRARRRCC